MARKKKVKILGIVFILIIVSWGMASFAKKETFELNITPEALLESINSDAHRFILDVRSEKEFSKGHVPGAVNIPYGQIGGNIGQIKKLMEGGSVVVYCESGFRAHLASEKLKELGIDSILHLDGDMYAWRFLKYPQETN